MNNLCDQSRLRVAWMRPKLPDRKTAVMAIDEWNSPNPWTEEQFNQIAKSKEYICRVVLTPKNTVIGFIVYQDFPTYHKIVKLVVDGKYQRLGIGTILINDLKKISSLFQPHRSISMKIPRGDECAYWFLTSCEFTIMAEAHNHIQMRWRE